MTGPPNESPHPDRNPPTVRMAQPAAPELVPSPPPGPSSAAYQLSLAHVLPWLEGDTSPRGRTSVPPLPRQQQSHLSASGWSWDAGGSIAQNNASSAATGGCRNCNVTAARKNSSGAANKHAAVPPAPKLRAAHTFTENSLAHGIVHQHSQQQIDIRHSSSFPHSFASSPALLKFSNAPAPVAISICGTVSETVSSGSNGNTLSCSSATNPSPASISSKAYSVHLPVLIPARALRPRGSFSFSGGIASSSSVAAAYCVSGNAGISGRPGSASNAFHSATHVQGVNGFSPHNASHSSWEGSSRGVASSPRQQQQQLALVVRGPRWPLYTSVTTSGVTLSPCNDHTAHSVPLTTTLATLYVCTSSDTTVMKARRFIDDHSSPHSLVLIILQLGQ
ncbi:hypothetical protein PoB_006489600 [Plakobranchus ocellatus]|uniref:Uncharacterized protein n=1 Tax=Plakobranchus ocellatus TaxID=259542 RepID=A0AAV4D2U5_9GAST|nr:hypothetical protein PoB_006489600 [Plakobranchus ocellatus]